MKSTNRESVLAIIAALLVLFSAMLNPVMTIALVVVGLIAFAVSRLFGRA